MGGIVYEYNDWSQVVLMMTAMTIYLLHWQISFTLSLKLDFPCEMLSLQMDWGLFQ